MGKFWGISADSWAEAWATVIGSLLAAGVAIWILWRQSRSQNAQASEDRLAQATEAENQRNFQASEFAENRKHDLELARRNREVDSLAELWQVFTAYVKAQEMLYRNWINYTTAEKQNKILRDTRQVISRYGIFEVTLYKWGINCGLDAECARKIALLFNVAASHIVTHAGENIHKGMRINDEIKQHAYTFAEQMLISGSSSPENKQQFLTDYVAVCKRKIDSIVEDLDAAKSKPIHESVLVQYLY